MRTDDLIAHLSSDLAPVPRGAMTRLLLAGVVLGVAGSAAVMLLWLGPRPDMPTAIQSFGLWMKLAYTLSLAGLGLWLVARAGRPGSDTGRPLHFVALPLAVLGLLAALQMAAPAADMHGLLMGRSSHVCATNILLVALPALVASLLVLRRMAPTRLPLAGAAAGLFAGAAGAFVYSFHCQEATAPFVVIWYSLGIALTAVFGAFLGRHLLRW